MLGVGRQREDCEKLIDARGWELAGLYVDNDVSAYSGKPRPEYLRLLSDLEAGTIDAVVAWHPDRLHRSPVELEGFVSIVERTGAAVETATAGSVDLTTPSGRMVARMLGAAARYEVEHKSERAKRKARQRAEQGLPNKGGTRPFGLTADWSEVVPGEADALRDAALRVLAGTPVYTIARELDAKGLRPPAGGRWTVTSLRRILTSWRAAGYREHEGERIARGTWPAILDVETVEMLRVRLSDPDRARFRRASAKYLLTGMLTCGKCGRPLFTRPTNDGERRYACTPNPEGCGGTSMNAEKLEPHIVEMVLTALDSPALADALAYHEDGPSDAVRRLHDAEAALVELSRDFYADRLITRAEFLSARSVIDSRIERAKGEVALQSDSAAVAPVVGSVRERWPELDLEAQRAIIAAVVEKIMIRPARRGFNRFDPDRVSVSWRV
jgi:DNA invertase Pin-like site-specific DNA recombinase